MRIKKVEMNMTNMNQLGKVSCGREEKRKKNKQTKYGIYANCLQHAKRGGFSSRNERSHCTSYYNIKYRPMNAKTLLEKRAQISLSPLLYSPTFIIS